ncbi:MAG: prolyl oligopeptidase family serine peptidase [Gammaproteobacteria bacterium]|nr:prolyl oligopeptidase family serine peptidase [Gammaproteobacteria bacterium]
MTAYGAWPSSITPRLVAEAGIGIGDPQVSGGAAYWLESRPAEAGRATLFKQVAGQAVELTPKPYSVRSRVHEYGGGAYLPTDSGVFFVNDQGQNIHRIAPDGGVSAVTDSTSRVRYAGFCLDAARRRLIAVTEIHGDGEPENALAAIRIDDGQVAMLHQGRDFYAAPRVSADGTELLFIAWDHPNMPWDGTQLLRCRLDGEAIGEAAVIAGGARESVMQPSWAPDGAVLYISDRSGYWNLHRLDDSGDRPVLADDADYGGPPWQFGQRSYACLNERLIAACRHGQAGQDLVLIDRGSGFASPLLEDTEGCGQLSVHGNDIYFLTAHGDRPTEFARLNPETGDVTVVAKPPSPAVDSAYFSFPERIAFPTRDGAEAYAFLYRPTHPDNPVAQGKPPLLTLCHGGPTGAASAALKLLVQFYTSRGWLVVDVDYRGSAGYGRAYREALNGRWGELDLSDCEDAVYHLAAQGEADPALAAIRGGSAGGYTVLRALTAGSVFRAGASHYGIGDLTALARDTHKFESRYLDALLGSEQALTERSPINHLDGLNCPVIFFQGAEDRIVPPNQAQAMVAALRAKGLPVAYIEYPGEGHGFRDGANIAHSIGAEYAFFCRVFGLPVPEGLPDIEVENL